MMENMVRNEFQFPNNTALQIVHGDLLNEELDAIVNAANKILKHGGGIAGLIVKRGGLSIQQESDAWVMQNGPIDHNNPTVTNPGKLPCEKIIHAVGPVWGEEDEESKLFDTVFSSLKLANDSGFKSIGYPAISTGIYGFPKNRAAPIMFNSIKTWVENTPQTSLKLIKIVLFDQPTLVVFERSFANWKEQQT